MQDADTEESLETKKWMGYDAWALNDLELPWLVDADGEPFLFVVNIVS
jgi:hypothetical protein